MSRLGPTGLTQLLTDIKTWVTTKLGNYVTTDTTQTVTGKKYFTNSTTQVNSVNTFTGSTLFIDTSASAPRGSFPETAYRVGRIYIGDGTSYNGSWFIIDPTIDTNRAYYRMVTTNPDNTDSARFSICWDSTKEGVRRRRNISMGDLLPSGASTYNLGELGNAWQDAYINKIHGISDYTNLKTNTFNVNTTLTHGGSGRRVILAMGGITLTVPAPEEGSWFLIKAVNGLVTLNLASNVTVTGITAGVFSGPIYLQPNESILLCYYSSTTYNAAISTIRRSGVVGRTGNVPAENPKHWFKIAENYVTATYRDPFICLRVFEGTTGNTIGTLCAHCRIDNTVGVVATYNCYLQWQDAGSGIDLSKYALTTNETSGTGVTIALWCTLTGGYSSLKFEVVSECGQSDQLGNPEWVLTRRRQADGDLAELLDTDFTKIVYSTLTTLKNDTTGKANNVTGIVAIANGGTGATTRLSAVKNLTNESVGTPTHFLTITTNWGKAGYTTVAQAKTVLGITGDMGSHSDSEYVHKTGDETIGGNKTFSNNIAINGTYLGTEASGNERTNIYLLANRDTAGTSGAYIGRFRQNRTQGAMESSDVSYITFDFLENSTRYTRCFAMGLTDWDSNGVPQTYYLNSPDGKGSLGTATTAWNKVYANSYYLGTTSFTDKFVTTDTAQTVAGTKTFNGDKIVITQGNGYRMVCNDNGGSSGYGIFQRVDGSSWYLMVTAQNDALGSWTSARPASMNLSTGVLSINGNAGTATQFSANKSVTLTGDVTGTASSKAGWSVATTLANSGVTAGSYGPATAASPAHGGTFSVPYVTVDAKGRVTAASSITITLPSDSNTDTLMTQNVSTTDSTYPILLCATANATSNQGAKTGIFGSGVKVNPKTSVVSAKGFSGIPTGNTYVTAVKDGGALVNSQATSWGAIWRAPTKDYQVAGATWSNTNNNVYICYSVTNANAEAGTNTMAKSLIWAADTGTLTTTTFSGALSGNASSATEFSANKDVTLTGDVTGTASSKAGWSVATTLANSGVTAGTYGPSEDVTGNNNTTISVPQITVDAKGRVTSVTNRTYTSVNTDTNTDTKVTQTVTNDNACYPLLIANTASASHTGLEPTTETDEVRKAYNINVQARYGFIYARNSYNADNLKGSIAGGNRTSAGFYGSTYDGVTVGGVELGRVDKYGNRYSRLYATNYITDGALAPDGTAVAATFDVGVLADGTKYLNTSAGWYCNVYPTLDNTRTLGTSSLRWKECYSNAYYLGTTAFGDIVTHNASEFLTSHQSLDNYVTLDSNQTITAIKTITGGNQGKMVFKNPDYNKGDANESGVIVSRLYFGNGASYDGANAVLSTSVDSSGNSVVELCAINNTANNSSRASLILSYDKSASSRLLKSWGNFLPYVDNTYTLGNSSSVWKECYCNTYYLGTTAFGDIVTHNASEFLTSHQSLSNYVTLDGTQTIAGTKTFSSTISGSISGNAGTATQFSANTTVTLTGDATGTSAGSKKGWSVPVTLANSGVTAGSYGPSTAVSPAHGGTFSVPYVTVDAKGRVTAASTITVTLPADSNTDTKVTQTSTAASSDYPVILGNTANNTATVTETTRFSKCLYVNARYGNINIKNAYNSANTKGVRNSATTYQNGIVVFKCYDDSEMGRIHCESNKGGYTRTYMQVRNYIKDGAISPEGSAVYSYLALDLLDNGSKRISTDAYWGSNVTPDANNTRTLGTSSLRWKECYSNAYYLGTTAFGDIVTHNASEFLTSHQSLSSCVKNVVTNNQTIKSTGITRGTAPSSAQTFGIAFGDNNNKYIGNIYGQYATDKSTYVGLYAYKGTTTSNGDNASVRVGYDASGNAYTYAPTPATADNSTQIATTAFVKAQGYLTSHQSLANYVTTNTDQSISGIKSHSKHISILGDYLGNEFSTNARTCLYLKSNRDTDGQSGIYFSKFRQNVAQGALTDSNLVSLNLDVLENSVRTNSCIAINFRYFENDVPTKIYVIPKAGVTSYMGTIDNPWTNAYINNLILNGNVFDPTSVSGNIGDIVFASAYYSAITGTSALDLTVSGNELYLAGFDNDTLVWHWLAPFSGTWKLLGPAKPTTTEENGNTRRTGLWKRIA